MTSDEDTQPKYAESTQTSAGSRGMSPVLAMAFLSLQVVILIVVALLLLDSNTPEAASIFDAYKRVESLEKIALALEDKSLPAQAAKAWEEYLVAVPNSDARPEVLFRIGQQYMKAEQYAEAAAAFVRSEKSGLDNEQMKDKVGPYLILCLRRLGRHGEVARELSRRSTDDQVKQGQVLANIDGQLLTDADLDRMIERRVDNELGIHTSTDPARRKELIEEYSRPESRVRFLQELLRVQLFTRRARDLKLDETDEFQSLRDSVMDNVLASHFQSHLLAKIQPSDVDIESFYKANAARYQRPPSIQVIYVSIKAGEKIDELLADIDSADAFKEFAKGRQPEDEELVSFTLVGAARHPILGDTSNLFTIDAGKWTTEPHEYAGERFLVLVEEKTIAQIHPLAEIRQRVELDYRQRKEDETLRDLFDNLLVRYNVKIIPPAKDRPTNAIDQ